MFPAISLGFIVGEIFACVTGVFGGGGGGGDFRWFFFFIYFFNLTIEVVTIRLCG